MEIEAPALPSETYRDIGAVLSSARGRMRITKEEAARILHIRVRYLEALEDGRLEELPGLPYVKGYLQTYAGFLDLDKEEILRRFEQIENLAKRGFYFPQVFSKEKNPNHMLVWGGLAVAVVAYSLWLTAALPPKTRVSMVEKMPPAVVEYAPVSLLLALNDACFIEQDLLYPPCYRVDKSNFSLLPLSGQVNSVMDVAPYKHISY